MSQVKVYTISPCPYCERAKSLLSERGISYEEVLVDRSDFKMREELMAKSRMKTFPQIFKGDEVIGGYQELAQLDEKDGLSSLK